MTRLTRQWFGVLALAAAATATSAQAQTVTLKFSHFLPPNSNFHKNVLEPWCAKVQADSKDRLKCQAYPALQLGGTPPQLIDQVKNGVADIAWTSPSYSTGRFPITEALELPFTLPSDALGSSRAMWDFYQQVGTKEFADFKMLALFSASGVVMSTAAKPAANIESYKGLKLRSPSRFAALLLTGLGGTPVNMPISQVTEGIAKGVIDGAMAPWEVLPSVKIDEVTKYHVDTPAQQAAFTQTPMVILMNKRKYDSLPADLKAVVDANSGAPMVELAAKAWAQGNEAARKGLAARGNQLITMEAGMYAAAQEAGKAVEKDWIQQANAKGLDGAALAAKAHEVGRKHLGQ